MSEDSKDSKKNEKPLAIEEKQPPNYDEDLRRLEISQLRILAAKRPKEYLKIAKEIKMNPA